MNHEPKRGRWHVHGVERAVRGGARGRLAGYLLSLLCACGGQTSAGIQTSPAPLGSIAPTVCGEIDDHALAIFDGASCPWGLVDDGVGLRLVSAAAGVSSLTVEPPAPCVEHPQSCRFEGVMSPLGPALLVIVTAPESEEPADVFLGVGLDGQRFAFTSLWGGDRSVIDGNAVGSVYTLVPEVCAELVLRLEPRLPEAIYMEPASTLSRRTGIYVAQGNELVLRADAPQSGQCQPLFQTLP
ncbi:MAG TPA: hypothetical protein ENJ18_04215 [Nannocystis exedens]|nr:hypothetical protein [Nannocystis exedens]